MQNRKKKHVQPSQTVSSSLLTWLYTSRLFLFIVITLSLCICFDQTASAEDLELINRPVNASGLTGLIQTTSPFVLPAKTFEISSSARSENSFIPSYSLNEYALCLSAGLGHGMEFSARSAYYTKRQEPLGTKTRDIDDVEVDVKWNFIKPAENNGGGFPAVSLIAGAVIPAKNRDLVTSSVDHWAAKIGLSLGSDLAWKEHVIGIYADALLTVQDKAQVATRDDFYQADAGVLFPISKSRNLQLMVEYTRVSGKEVLVSSGGDYSALTWGLRLVSERFNLSIGTQFMQKKDDAFDDSSRVIGIMSYKI